MKKMLLILVTAIGFGIIANAQDVILKQDSSEIKATNTNKVFRFGIRAGMNFTNMSGYDGLSKMIFGFQSGVVTDFSLPKNFSLQAGLLVAQQGYKIKGTYMQQKSTRRITLYYLQLPINAQYKINFKRASLFFQTGPYFGYCFLGTARDSDDDITLPIRMGYGERDELKTFDFGLGLGVGVQIYGLQVGVGYNIGLYNLRPSYMSDKQRNHGLAITYSYLFGKPQEAKKREAFNRPQKTNEREVFNKQTSQPTRQRKQIEPMTELQRDGVTLLGTGLGVMGLGTFFMCMVIGTDNPRHYTVGAVCVGIGGALTIASIPVLSVASARKKAASYTYQPTLDFNYTGNGLGIALKL